YSSHSPSFPHCLSSFPTRRSSDLFLASATDEFCPLMGRYTRAYAVYVREKPIINPLIKYTGCGMVELKVNPAKAYDWLRYKWTLDRKSTRLNSSHVKISYAVFCLK